MVGKILLNSQSLAAFCHFFHVNVIDNYTWSLKSNVSKRSGIVVMVDFLFK